MDAVAYRIIAKQGTPESVWGPWLAARAVRTVTASSLCPAASRLVVVAPHPDDELLCCGALMALHAAMGGTVLVLAVTDGEASHGAADARLGRRRRLERSAGLDQLGIPPLVVSFGLPDGAVAAREAELALYLQARLQPSDTVLCTWRLDGHPDHESTGRAAAVACAATGSRLVEAPVWMWNWSRPGDPRVPWQDLVALALPPRVLAAKRQALLCHHSQLLPRSRGQGPVLDAAIVARAARGSEYFFVSGGAH